MTDLFADFVPDAWIDSIFAVMALCPQHTFQILTKRAGRMRAYMGDPSLNGRKFAIELARQQLGLSAPIKHVGWPLTNVWLGVSCENQSNADERIPELLATPAAVRFVSCEPMLGPLDLTVYGGKDIENRSWATSYRGPLLIHASKGMTKREYEVFCELVCGIPGVEIPDPASLARGGIIGRVRLVDCVEDANTSSPWFFGPYGFVLKDPEPLPFKPMRGRLGFFEAEL